MPTELRRRDFLGGIALASIAHRAAIASPPSAASALRDCMPDFWTAYDAGRSGAVPARAQALVDGFFHAHAGDYRQAGVDPTLQRVAAWLPRFDAIAADVRALHRRFAAGYEHNLARFRAALPDFDGQASPVALLPSLDRFDAHLQPDGQQLPLFFGPDGIVRYHGPDADLGVLFAHELFHCYQAQRNPSMSLDEHPPVFAGLWIEGIATFASERLNPGASLVRVLLDDQRLAQADAATLKQVAQALLARLDATDAAAQAAFFDSGHHGDWPARAGYYVGLLAARELGKTMTLQQMAALPARQVRASLQQVLPAIGS